jgi:hypothetical protein
MSSRFIWSNGSHFLDTSLHKSAFVVCVSNIWLHDLLFGRLLKIAVTRFGKDCTLVRKLAVYESASRPEASTYRDAIVQFWVSAVGNTVACTTADPLQTFKLPGTGRYLWISHPTHDQVLAFPYTRSGSCAPYRRPRYCARARCILWPSQLS